MTNRGDERRGGTTLRFVVSGALLLGVPACGGPEDGPTVNEPESHRHTINEPVEHEPEETINEPPPEPELAAASDAAVENDPEPEPPRPMPPPPG